MSLELASTIAGIGTFVVIAATAVAAIVQLRHLRSSNQIAALTECREVIESQRFSAALRFIEARLPDLIKQPRFAARLKPLILDDELEPVAFVANFFENMGAFVRYGIIDKDIACDLWGDAVLGSWKALLPIGRIRREVLAPRILENFEYLAVMSDDFIAKHPEGTYPKARGACAATSSRAFSAQACRARTSPEGTQRAHPRR